MELTEDIIYVEESSFKITPVAVKDILMMKFIPIRWSDGVWATAYIYCRGTNPLWEHRLFWVDPFFDKQNLSKIVEEMTANIFPQSDFFRVVLDERNGASCSQYIVIYGPEVNITEDRLTFKNREDSQLVFNIDPKISGIFREAFRDWERRSTVESRG